MPANVSYEIKAVPGRGNALVATELILKGEVIFTEKPSIWHSRSTSKGFCSSCGKLILLDASAKDESSAGHIYCSNSRSRGGVSNTDSLKDGIKTSCIASYCCDLCRDDAELAGHRWLCGEAFVKRYEVSITETLSAHCSLCLFLSLEYNIIEQNNSHQYIHELSKETCDTTGNRIVPYVSNLSYYDS